MLVCGSSLLQQTLNLSRSSNKICTVYCGQFCRLPDVVNIYCLIVFPLSYTVYYEFKAICKVRVTLQLTVSRSLLVSSPRFKSMCEYCFLSFIGHPLWRKSGPIHVWSLCWLYLCSVYRELNVIYTTHYIPGLTNLWRAERCPWHATFTAVPFF